VTVKLGEVDRDVGFRGRQGAEPGTAVVMRQDLLVRPPVFRGVTISAPLPHPVAVAEAEPRDVDRGRGRAAGPLCLPGKYLSAGRTGCGYRPR
jgi:hypothetical protein